MKKIISLLTVIVLSLTTFVCYAEGSVPENVVDNTVATEIEQTNEHNTTETEHINNESENMAEDTSSAIAESDNNIKDDNNTAVDTNSDTEIEYPGERDAFKEDVINDYEGAKKFYIVLATRKYRISHAVYFGETNLTSDDLAEWAGKIYDYACKYGERLSFEESEKLQSEFNEKIAAGQYSVNHSLQVETYDVSGDNIMLFEKMLYIDNGQTDLTFVIENPEAFLEYVKSILPEIGGKVGRRNPIRKKYTNIDFENMTSDHGEVYLVERMNFQFDTGNLFEDSFMDNIASPNTTVDCKIEQLQLGIEYVLVLTLDGDIGSKSYCTADIFRGFGLNQNFTQFMGDATFDGKDMLFYADDPVEPQIIRFTGKTSTNGVPTAEMSVSFGNRLTSLKSIELKNIEYEFYGKEDNLLHQNRNLSVLFGLTREKLVDEAKKNQTTEEQDPERWVTKWKGVDANGDPIGYYVNFAAQFDVNLSGNTMPAWYKKLGDNVTATMPVLIRTYKGVAEKKINHPFMLLKGDKGYKWFMISKTGVSDGYFSGEYKNGKNPQVDIVFSELISFDGYNVVRNTVEYEQISAYIRYSDDGNLTPLGMELRVGGKSQYTEAEDIICIGEGGLSFDNIG